MIQLGQIVMMCSYIYVQVLVLTYNRKNNNKNDLCDWLLHDGTYTKYSIYFFFLLAM